MRRLPSPTNLPVLADKLYSPHLLEMNHLAWPSKPSLAPDFHPRQTLPAGAMKPDASCRASCFFAIPDYRFPAFAYLDPDDCLPSCKTCGVITWGTSGI